MTITHLTHFDLTECGRTSDNIVFSGTLGACKRMAAAHGMEIEKYEGYIVGIDGNRATFTPATPANFSRIWFIGGGMIQKAQSDYTLVMPLVLWDEA